MNTIFHEINNDFYLLEHLTYNSETKVFTVLTKELVVGKKLASSAPKIQSTTLLLKAFISILHQET